MKIKLVWGIAAVFLFIFFLIAKLPAKQVLGRIDFGQDVAMQQVSGTFWQGTMARLVVNDLPVDNFSWTVNPFGLLIGNLSGEIKGGNLRDPDDVAVDGKISLALFDMQPVKSNDLLVFLPTARVLAGVALPVPVKATGRFRMRFEALDFGPQCNEMQAWGDWLNASVGGTQGPIPLGTFTAKISCDNNNIKMQVDEPNQLGLSFISNTSADFSSFQMTGKFKISSDLPQEVHQAGRFFGSPGADGYTSFEL